ncbi:diguanylate cyclase with PAS/PAC sensor [Pseudidiomarina planktonica]|uniref:diguanylate cyclase n=1 Tax=Pseudidiomarina planktonica TaxID=1323738 RepID=A0A1Y6EW47_9GAMM|nr:diguanylate cyclase [Pseudidiomarina planktonica]SMQ65481.1 diguanylate cyclase with PAS/PAC sensor [Pseudidiomarina planktonica]
MFALIVVAAWVTLSVQREQADLAAREQLNHATAIVADAADFMLNTRKKALQQWAENIRQVGPEQVSLANESALKVLFDNLLVLSPEGRVLDDWPIFESRRNADASFRDYYKRAVVSAEVVLSEPFLTDPNQLPLVNLSYAVRDGRGDIIAILVGSMSLRDNSFLKALERTQIGLTGYISVISADGLIISHPQQDFIMQAIPEDREIFRKRVLAGWRGVVHIEALRGGKSLQSYESLQDNNWIIAGVIPEEEAYAAADQATRTLLLAIITAAFVVMIIIWWLLHLQMRHLPRLTNELSRLQAGARAELDPIGYEEIDALVVAFNQLLEDNHVSQQQLQQRQVYLQSILEASSAGLFVVDNNGKAEFINSAVARITGWPKQLFQDGDWCKAMPANDAKRVCVMWQQALEDKSFFSLDHRYVRPEGNTVWVNCQLYPVEFDQKLVGMVGTIVDVSMRYAREKELINVANEDALTKLANRRGYDEKIEKLFNLHRQQQVQTVLLSLDLDHFKSVNDSAGHEVGDWVLQQLAKIIVGEIRVDDFAARVGGDEFAVLLRDCDEKHALQIAERIRREVEELEHEHPSVKAVTISIGLAASSIADEYVIDWIRRADRACYEAKNKGRNQVVIDGLNGV